MFDQSTRITTILCFSLARLVRIHVITPAVGRCTMRPRVRFADADDNVVHEWDCGETVSLPANSYCVLRLPYVYVDAKGETIVQTSPSTPLQALLMPRAVLIESD